MFRSASQQLMERESMIRGEHITESQAVGVLLNGWPTSIQLLGLTPDPTSVIPSEIKARFYRRLFETTDRHDQTVREAYSDDEARSLFCQVCAEAKWPDQAPPLQGGQYVD